MSAAGELAHTEHRQITMVDFTCFKCIKRKQTCIFHPINQSCFLSEWLWVNRGGEASLFASRLLLVEKETKQLHMKNLSQTQDKIPEGFPCLSHHIITSCIRTRKEKLWTNLCQDRISNKTWNSQFFISSDYTSFSLSPFFQRTLTYHVAC